MLESYKYVNTADTIFNKEDWSDNDWKVIEKIFKFKSAKQITIAPSLISGYGIPIYKDEEDKNNE